MTLKLQLVLGFILDLLLGDPRWLLHPVRVIGYGISSLEKIIRRFCTTPLALKIGGFILTGTIVGGTLGLSCLILEIARAFSPGLYLAVGVVLVYFELAGRCLAQEAYGIYRCLKNGRREEARKRLAGIVGRDTENLSEQEIIRATVETVAENCSDGIVAPLFYIALGGPAWGMAYKAVNTLDSMVGYLNERYRHLGYASARLDDLANWLPSRLCAVLILVSAPLMGRNFRQGYRILRRDCRNHESPNAGYPEAAMAGILGIQLGGTNTYFGQPVFKPTIGDQKKELELNDITHAIGIMLAVSFLALLAALGLAMLW